MFLFNLIFEQNLIRNLRYNSIPVSAIFPVKKSLTKNLFIASNQNYPVKKIDKKKII